MKSKLICITAFTLTFFISSFVILYSNSYEETDAVSTLRSDKAELWNRVLSFENKDLFLLSNQQNIKLFNDFYELLDKDLYVGFGNSVLFTKITDDKNQIRYVLIGAAFSDTDDSPSMMNFQIFDENGNHLFSREIVTDRSFSYENIKIGYSSKIGREVIEMKDASPNRKTVIKKHIFALADNDIRRIE